MDNDPIETIVKDMYAEHRKVLNADSLVGAGVGTWTWTLMVASTFNLRLAPRSRTAPNGPDA